VKKRLFTVLISLTLIGWSASLTADGGKVIEVPLPDPNGVRVLAPPRVIPPVANVPDAPEHPPASALVAPPVRVTRTGTDTPPSAPWLHLKADPTVVSCSVIVASIGALGLMRILATRRGASYEADFRPLYDAIMRSAATFFPGEVIYNVNGERRIQQAPSRDEYRFAISPDEIPGLHLGSRKLHEVFYLSRDSSKPLRYTFEVQVVEGRLPGTLALQFRICRFVGRKIEEYVFPPQGGVQYWIPKRNGTVQQLYIGETTRAGVNWMKRQGSLLLENLKFGIEATLHERETNQAVNVEGLPPSILGDFSLDFEGEEP